MNGKELLGTKYVPDGLQYITQLAKRAKAYHSLTPYPWFGFSDWKTEDRGPLPKCLPFTRSIVKRGARWLFGKGMDIMVRNSESLTVMLNTEWRDARMPSKMLMLAENAAQEGSYCIRFHVDAENKKVKFSILSQIDNVRVYLDPTDQDRVLMTRVQFPYFDARNGVYYMHREEWTEDLYVKYKPKPVTYKLDPSYQYGLIVLVTGTNYAPDAPEIVWEIESSKPNPYKVIPVVTIHNVERNSQWGMGDLWSLEQVIDRVNLTYHLMDKSNQFDSTPTPIFIDAVLEDDAINKPLAPGEQLSIKTDDVDGSGLQAKFGLMEPSGKMRPYMMDYADNLMKMIYEGAGSIKVDPEEITNKGNLTQSVLTQIYGPLIDTTEEKRRNYGDYGVAVLVDKLLTALRNLGLFSGKVKIPKDPDIEIKWPDFFMMSDSEIRTRLDRLMVQEGAGLTTKDRVIRAMASADGIENVEALIEELKDYEPQLVPEAPPSNAPPAAEAKSLGKPKQGKVTL